MEERTERQIVGGAIRDWLEPKDGWLRGICILNLMKCYNED